MKQKMDRSDQSRFKQCLQQPSGESSVVPVFKVSFLKESAGAGCGVRGASPLQLHVRKKKAYVSTRIQAMIITVRQNRLFSKGAPCCLFLPISLVSMKPCWQQD